jgi:adenylate cyclase
MPGLSGIETLAAVGDIDPEITRILLTGYATLEGAIQATNEGIDGFLTKPFENIEIRQTVKELYIKKKLKQFVPQQVLNRLQENPESLNPQKVKSSILFTDIRGFTTMSQKYPPEVISHILNKYYFTSLGPIIFKHNETIDKYIGDSVMAIFGAPLSYEDDAIRAIKAAIDMQNEIEKINTLLNSENDPFLKEYNIDKIQIDMGIGIGTGEVITAFFGSNIKKEYTAIGPAVNIASRLESIAKKNQIVICEKTYELVKDHFEFEKVDNIKVKGIDENLTVYLVKK